MTRSLFFPCPAPTPTLRVQIRRPDPVRFGLRIMDHALGNKGVETPNLCLVLSRHSEPCAVPPSHDVVLTKHEKKSQALVTIGMRYRGGPMAGRQHMNRVKSPTQGNTHSKDRANSNKKLNNKNSNTQCTRLISYQCRIPR